MAVADGAILRIVASLLFPDSVIAQNVFYAVFADTGTSDDEQDVVDDLADWVDAMYTDIAQFILATIDPSGIKVYNYDSGDDDWDEVGDAALTFTPIGSGEMVPHGVAQVVHAKTTNPDIQATKFLGGLPEGNKSASTPTAPALAAYGNFNDTWVTPFVGTATGADFAPGVWSPTRTNFFLFSGTTVVNGVLGYQRRRKPGVGI